MTDDLPAIPADHPIQEIWETGRKIATLPGLIELAEKGDIEAAKTLLTLFSYRQLNPDDLGRKRIHQTELLDYFARCFNAIIGGESAEKALHLSTGKKSRPPMGHQTKRDRSMIGWEIANLHRQENVSIEVSCERIAEKHNVSVDTAKKAYQTYMVVRKK